MIPAQALRALAAPMLVLATACIVIEPGLDGSGRIVTQSRAASGFDAVAVEDDFDVVVTVGPPYAVTATGDDNLLPFVRTQVRGRTLHVERTRRLDPTGSIRVAVSTPTLSGLASSGSADVRASGIRAATFATSVSGSSDVVAEGDFGDLRTSISGSGKIRMRGAADEIEGSVSGSGELDLAQVVGRAARVRVSGSGDAVVRVIETLDAVVSGSGDVRYLGNPRVESSVSGSGSVRQARSRR